MKHPAETEWMDYIYNEAAPARRRELKAHLRDCPECQSRVGGWQSVGRALDRSAPRGRAWNTLLPAKLKWAAAAVLAIGLGYASGRASASANAKAIEASFGERVRAAVEVGLRESYRRELDGAVAGLRREFAEDLKKQLAASRQEQRASFVAALERVESRHAEDFTTLRKDLDTVAVLTEAGLQRTQSQLIRLASSAREEGDTAP